MKLKTLIFFLCSSICAWSQVSEEVYQEALHDAKQNSLFGKIDSDPRFSGCERMASEVGRIACANIAVQKFINRHLQYPEAAIEQGLEGTVVVMFVVEKNGTLSGISIIEDIGGGCGEEVKRIVNKMPRWKAARRANKKIAAEHEIAVEFSLGQ